MVETFLIIIFIAVLVTLIAAVVTPILVEQRLRKQQREEMRQLIGQVEQSISASVKLLEVRNYYEQTSKELNKMLQEAYREGNRFRQDQLRKTIERLEALKAIEN